jgi:hypothetical protein
MTRPDGTFRVTGFPPGVRVDLRTHRHDPDAEALRPASRDGVPAGSVGVVLTMERGLEISGVVVAPDGRPLPRFTVLAFRENGIWNTRTDDAGRFALGGLPPGRVRLRIDEGGAVNLATLEVEPPARDLRIVVEPAVEIRGRLEGEGRLEGFLVSAKPDEPGTIPSATTGPDGSFVLRTKGRVTHSLLARRGGDDRYGLLEGVVPGGDDVVVRLRTGLSISGRVQGSGGDAGVVLHSLTGFPVTMREGLDEARRFRFRGLPPGRYRIRAMTGKQASVDVEAGATDVVLPAE